MILRGSVVHALGPNGEAGLVPTYRHSTGDYLRAALSAGLEIRQYLEPVLEDDEPASDDDSSTETADVENAPLDPGPWKEWPWSLMPLIPEAIQAGEGPTIAVWHLQLPG